MRSGPIHLENLARQLSDPMPPAGKLVAVSEIPPHYLERREDLKQLRDLLLADLKNPAVVSGAVDGSGSRAWTASARACSHLRLRITRRSGAHSPMAFSG